ncbi:uncharacterized protein LOC120773649 [Bactrocera tryoni]|uniref:uncharacterized protein LOC120773649 n=1 Tax=Bactrocera tryoni TaxID=59916 RepID=UPI001A984296|nr:uncharacterized protein LOC120773649 [Bactrocera tryoni]
MRGADIHQPANGFSVSKVFDFCDSLWLLDATRDRYREIYRRSLEFSVRRVAIVAGKGPGREIAESFTEVDDDGNEIEVKRFYIEGRQLNGGRRQCYETRRRKRSYAYGQEDDKSNDEILTASSTAPSGIDTAVSIDEEDDMEEEKPVGVYGIRQGSADNGEQNMADNGADVDENEDGDEGAINLPVVAQITHQSSVQSNPAAEASNHNGIVIVQGNMPPKVDPQTHAVFELLPVGNKEDGDDGLDSDDYGDDSQLLYQEEISPVSTTAIWSTGEDEPLPYGQAELETDTQDYADIDEEQNSTAKPKPSKRPTKRPTKKPSKKPSRKPSRRPVKKRPNNKRPNTSSGKRRRPSKRNKNSSKRRGTSNNKRRRQRPNYEDDDFDGLRLTANRLKNHKLDNLKYKRKQLNKENEANQGTNTFTKTETLTRTGTADDEKNVNCIIINKTTTPRPFWGLFGRSADGDEPEAKEQSILWITRTCSEEGEDCLIGLESPEDRKAEGYKEITTAFTQKDQQLQREPVQRRRRRRWRRWRKRINIPYKTQQRSTVNPFQCERLATSALQFLLLSRPTDLFSDRFSHCAGLLTATTAAPLVAGSMACAKKQLTAAVKRYNCPQQLQQ